MLTENIKPKNKPAEKDSKSQPQAKSKKNNPSQFYAQHKKAIVSHGSIPVLPEKLEQTEQTPRTPKKAQFGSMSRRPQPVQAQNSHQAPAKNLKPAQMKDVKPAASVNHKPERQKAHHEINESPAGKKKDTSLKIIPLGGVNEIGKNMYCYECSQDIFIVDCGLAFPDSDMLGIDIVIPDFSYIEKNINRVRGVVITHGHEDHIGAIPYLLKKFDLPVYGTRLTLGLIENKLKEHGLASKAKLNVVKAGATIKMGCMAVEFINVNHSIPDAVAFAIHTPAGIVIHTGDFKIDYTPIEGQVIDLARFGELGEKGVLALLSDSTNAERPGTTASERKVGESFDSLFSGALGKRIIIATFSSNIHRAQQIINNAHKFGRKVAVSGRSMINALHTALELGYLKVPDDVLIDIESINRIPSEKVVVITTGSQGEPLSALSRMAAGEHRNVNVTAEDLIIISATPIPGNEKHVNKVINDLMKLGAEVIYEKMYEVHVSGHACQDELKLILSLTRPKYVMPVHGEYKHIKRNAMLAESMGVLPSNIIISEIGQVVEISSSGAHISGIVPSGAVMVDGLGVGDVGSIVLRDRKHLSQDGLIVSVAIIDGKTRKLVSGPDIVSRGFVYVRESEKLMDDARVVVKNALDSCINRGITDWNSMKADIRDGLAEFIYKKTKRRPMIIPVIMEV